VNQKEWLKMKQVSDSADSGNQSFLEDKKDSAWANRAAYLISLLVFLFGSISSVWLGIDELTASNLAYPNNPRVEAIVHLLGVVGIGLSFGFKWIRPVVGCFLGSYAALFQAIQQPWTRLRFIMFLAFLAVFLGGAVIQHRRLRSLQSQ
jgi:hypothetical protein